MSAGQHSMRKKCDVPCPGKVPYSERRLSGPLNQQVLGLVAAAAAQEKSPKTPCLTKARQAVQSPPMTPHDSTSLRVTGDGHACEMHARKKNQQPHLALMLMSVPELMPMAVPELMPGLVLVLVLVPELVPVPVLELELEQTP